jgi:hypothetical protein
LRDRLPLVRQRRLEPGQLVANFAQFGKRGIVRLRDVGA